MPVVHTTTSSLISRISDDENVVDALNDAIALACSKALAEWSPYASPIGFVRSRSWLDAVTYSTSVLRAYNFIPKDINNQRHLVNNSRYDVPVEFILSNAKKVRGGFRVAHKGPITLQMVVDNGQYAMFPEDVNIADAPCYWVLFDIREYTRHLKVYLARPVRLSDQRTLLEATEFRTLYDGVLESTNAISYSNGLSTNDFPMGQDISVAVTEITDAEPSNDSPSSEVGVPRRAP